MIAGLGQIEIESRRIGNVVFTDIDGDGSRHAGGVTAVNFGGGRGHREREISGESGHRVHRHAGQLIGLHVIQRKDAVNSRQFRTVGQNQDSIGRKVGAFNGDAEGFGAVRIGETGVDVEWDGGRPGSGGRTTVGIGIEIKARRVGDPFNVNVDKSETGLIAVYVDFANRQRKVHVRVRRRLNGQPRHLVRAQSPATISIAGHFGGAVGKVQNGAIRRAFDGDGGSLGEIPQSADNIDGNGGVFVNRCIKNVDGLVAELDDLNTGQGIDIALNAINSRRGDRDFIFTGRVEFARDGIGAKFTFDNGGICAFAADDDVAAGTADQQVITGITDEGIVKGTADNAFDIDQGVAFGVAPGSGSGGQINHDALEGVGVRGNIEIGAAVQNISTCAADQDVVAGAAENNIVTGTRINDVITGAAVNGLTGGVEIADIHDVVAIGAGPIGIGNRLQGLINQPARFGHRRQLIGSVLCSSFRSQSLLNFLGGHR